MSSRYADRESLLSWTMITVTGNYTFMPRAILCRLERERLPKSPCLPMTCAMYRGASMRHNPGGVCYSQCGKQSRFIPSEVLKNLIGGLLIDLCSISIASDYAV